MFERNDHRPKPEVVREPSLKLMLERNDDCLKVEMARKLAR
jgi:hypothetical protein